MTALDDGVLAVCAADARLEVQGLMKQVRLSELSHTEIIALFGILRVACERVHQEHREPARVLQIARRKKPKRST